MPILTLEKKSFNIVVSGSTGLIGTALCQYLSDQGHQVRRLVRRRPKCDTRKEIYWNPDSGFIETTALENTDIIIHLSGKNIFSNWWSKKQKKIISESRIQSTQLLSHSLARLKHSPRLFISASAIGYYGNRSNEIIDENSKPGVGFLADVCKEWENATLKAQHAGIPVINLRTGIVLSAEGGFLKSILPLFRMGLGNVLGTGEQFMSWISLTDMVKAIEHLIITPNMEGPVNIVSPNPVTNANFSHALAQVLHRPCSISIPTSMVRFFLGKRGQELVLSSCKAVPSQLLKNGYIFQHAYIEEALKSILSIDKKHA